MSSSFTIWYDPPNSGLPAPKIELHINLWVDINKKDCIDFGLMINEHKSIKELFIYIPFKIEDKDVENLLLILAKDKPTSDLVFNENVELKEHIGLAQKVKRGNDNFGYYLKDGIIETELDSTKLTDGSIIRYTLEKNLDNEDIYIRFRIKNIHNKGIVERHEKSVAYMTGGHNTLTSIEINFNEFRKLPQEVYQKAHHQNVPISLVNLFVMTDVHMEYIFSNIKNVKSRILEKEKWKTYNPILETTQSKKILAYQFKKRPDSKDGLLKDFSIFSKFDNEGKKFRGVFLAIVIAISLGIFGSLSASLVDFKYPRWKSNLVKFVSFEDDNSSIRDKK